MRRRDRDREGREKGVTTPVNTITGLANKRSVWTVSTQACKEAHFATYPELLISPCIKAGCPEGGIVLDPFHGSGTTGIVATKLNRNYIGIELNPEYKQIEDRRRYIELGMFDNISEPTQQKLFV